MAACVRVMVVDRRGGDWRMHRVGTCVRQPPLPACGNGAFGGAALALADCGTG